MQDTDLQDEIRRALEHAWADGSWSAYDGAPQEALCRIVRDRFHVAHVNLCSSGTIALEIALRAVGVTAGDDVILAGYDFPGNFRAIEAIGARPVLVDLASDSHRIDVAQVQHAWSPQTRAVIVSHLHGQRVDVGAVRAALENRSISIVEDACQTPGADWQGRPIGSLGDVGILSFGGSKLLSSGRGGAWLTNDREIHQRGRLVHDRGNDAFPLSNLQAAVLPPQLQRLTERAALRRVRARQIVGGLRAVPELVLPLDDADLAHSDFYKFPMLIAGGEPARDRFVIEAHQLGLELGAGFRGFALRSARRCRRVGELPHVRRAAAETCLLHHTHLVGNEAETAEVIQRLKTALVRSRTAE